MRFATLLLTLSLLFFPLLSLPASAAAEPHLPAFSEPISAESAALCEASGRTLLVEKNADRRMPMASTTKIMTALVALEKAPLDRVVKIPKEAAGIEGSSVYLTAGDCYTIEMLLYALMLQSANDAAAAIAYAVGGSIEGFAALMNERAEELGLCNTHFANPHGLDDPAHYTTASDLALLAAEALDNPDFFTIVSTRKHTFTATDGGNPRLLVNHNKMLLLYEGAVGVKTGFTKKSGRCLVSAAKRDGMTLVAVTLDAPSDWGDHRTLLDFGFSHYENRCLAAAGEISITLPLFNTEGECRLVNRDEIYAVLPKETESPAPVLQVFPHPTAPKKAGEVGGEVTFSLHGEVIASSPLVFSEKVSLKSNSKGWLRGARTTG